MPPQMRAVVQRVKSASVTIENEIVGEIDRGLVVLLGIETQDTLEDLEWLAAKLVNQRLFPGDEGPWSQSVIEVRGGILLVSQFTLHASTRKGRSQAGIERRSRSRQFHFMKR
jgi:D-aminoacyl-tRNA deacylase